MMNDKNYNITIDANVSTDDREILEKVGTTILDERNRARIPGDDKEVRVMYPESI